MSNSSQKITVLLVWGYQRKGWIEPFEKIKERFNFVYLHFIHPEEETACFTDCRRIFWSEYENANAILDDVKPSKIVFMSLYNGLDIALNIAARKRNITTYILQHGMFTTYADYRAREVERKRSKVSDRANAVSLTTNHHFNSLLFVKNSLNFTDYLKVSKFPLYYYLQKTESSLYASKHVRFQARKPDYYICYTLKNAQIHFELDKPDISQVLLIGNPEFDSFFNQWNQLPDFEENYYLHIDQAFAGNRFGESIVIREEMVLFWEKLNIFCKSKGAKLKIKLHPESFNSNWLPADENIEWLREVPDMVSLIKNSLGCFGFFSTLLIPAVYYKKTILFKMSNSDFQQNLLKMGVIDLLDFYQFEPENIHFERITKESSCLHKFEEEYFYKTDGKAIQRLQSELESIK
jgi:hypothetical protein